MEILRLINFDLYDYHTTIIVNNIQLVFEVSIEVEVLFSYIKQFILMYNLIACAYIVHHFRLTSITEKLENLLQKDLFPFIDINTSRENSSKYIQHWMNEPSTNNSFDLCAMLSTTDPRAISFSGVILVQRDTRNLTKT